jgi:hypothetical protein
VGASGRNSATSFGSASSVALKAKAWRPVAAVLNTATNVRLLLLTTQ